MLFLLFMGGGGGGLGFTVQGLGFGVLAFVGGGIPGGEDGGLPIQRLG